MVEPNMDFVQVDILPCPGSIDMIQTLTLQNPSIKIIRLAMIDLPKRPKLIRFDVYSCVTTVKNLLGIHWFFTITPHALYSKLIKRTPKHLKII